MTGTPITTLEQARAWLTSLRSQSTVEVSSSLFGTGLVTALLEMLDGPVALDVTKVDGQAATLAGTATVLGEAGTSATFTFEQPEHELLCELQLALPASVRWTLLSDLDVTFGGLGATFSPDPALHIVRLDLTATLAAGKTGELSFPVDISVPAFDGDWHVIGTLTPLGSLTDDALDALAAGQSPRSILAPPLRDLSRFTLTTFEAALDPTAETCSLIRIGIGCDTSWKFFSDMFEVVGITLDFAIFRPFETRKLIEAGLTAKMRIGTTLFDVGGRFPDQTVYARIAAGSSLDVTQAFHFLHVPLPSGFPTIEISTLAFVLYTADDSFDFQLGIDKPVPILGGLQLDNLFFEIRAAYDRARKVVVPAGSLHAQLSIGATKLLLGGSYASAGITLEGEVDDVPVGALVAKLARDFGISSVPAPIGTLALKRIAARLDTVHDSFAFDCEATIEIAGVEAGFALTIELTYVVGGFEAVFGATLTLRTRAGKELQFAVTFSETHEDMWITAEYSGAPLRLGDLADALGLSPPPHLPSDLDLSLTDVGLLYDLTTQSLVLGAQSHSYGKATFVACPLTGKRQFFFVLDSGQSFSLSDLPLVGHELARIENVSISDLRVLVATVAADAATAASINAEISKLKRAAYPRLPAAGTNETLELAALLEIGDEQLPLHVGMGVTDTQLPRAVAQEVLASPTAGTGPAAWFDVQRSFGPLSLQRIGVTYEPATQSLWFDLDADLAIGPLAVSLAGLGIGSPLKTFSPSFSLQGLGVGFSEPPLQLAGGLVNLAPPGAAYIEFEGGLVVGVTDLQLQAYGYYGDRQGFSSFFVFGALAYPIGGPPSFFVTGAALGLGYNSSLRIPTIDEVSAFPFIAVLPGSTAPNTGLFGSHPTPVDVLNDILHPPTWVTPEAGSLWIAAGITFTNYEIVNGQALVLLDVGQHELVAALVGTARAQFPQLVSQSSHLLYANLELDILARFAPIEGVFSVQAQLSKSSFVLDRACVLTGGFAFFVWFGDSPNAGDFVLTVGGYGAGYKPPPYYPAVPRLGFHWSLDDSVSVRGEAYLAVTPAVLMAGGKLDVTYHAGNLKAWFDAHVDVLIRWKPFWIDANIGITIGASYKVNGYFTSFKVSVELGCDLALWGPPTGGSVRVDWYVISFTINFGSARHDAPKIKGWSDLETLLPNTSATDGARNVVSLAPSDGVTTTETSPGPGGVAESPATGGPLGSGPWAVRAGRLAFECSTSIPATAATVGAHHAFRGDAFDVHPLGWKQVNSTYAVSITNASGADVASAFSARQTSRSVPASLWGAPPERHGRPQVPAPDEQLVAGQIMGISIAVLPPELGATAGPIDVQANLAASDLELAGADLPLSGDARPTGDMPVASEQTVARIADGTSGIASPHVTAIRGAINAALLGAGYLPAGSDDSLEMFAASVGCALTADPLLVS